ncbi:hypothetical protein A5740_00045 [Mycobacterium sp. GA-1841]|uniref:PepSY domain-containing protein n=1 Tax=Mycobacterium sp. GA-1841 TaxID=1834154 RepID=UPI00096F0AE2|nr:PepSY domain-containing protein [Mycobacterium sp. GA-1841]OMC37760.1 hypothetical protein A5740_00045 [Mycobacterium sp. GA-1841]
MLGNNTPADLVRIAGAATVMAAVVACGGGQSSTASSPVEPGGTGAAAPTGNTALLAAAETVRGTVPDSTVISVESERDNTQWEVQVVTPDGIEHEAEVSADGATVLNSPVAKPEDPKDVAKHRSRLQAAKLDHRAAVDAITKAVDGRITELNLDDRDGGTVVWEADVVDSANALHEVSVDAATGDVVARN